VNRRTHAPLAHSWVVLDKSEGVVKLTSSLPYVLFSKSFICNTYAPPRKCCKQKTYAMAKPVRCNTYKKHGGGCSSTFNLQTLKRSHDPSALSPFLSGYSALPGATAFSQPFSYQSFPHSFGRDGACALTICQTLFRTLLERQQANSRIFG
jgi:hypothetical protein